MRSNVLKGYLSALPEELRSVIQTVRHTESAVSNSSGTVRWTIYEDIPSDLFLLSEKEVFGVSRYGKQSESTQYAYYSAGNSKIAHGYNAPSSGAVRWWLRTAASRTMCVCVDENGAAAIKNAKWSYGVYPAFVV